MSEDPRCPPTYRREGAVKTLIELGWTWDGNQWVAPSQHASVEAWERELTAVMPADFKDWHENSKREWPAIAAAVITGQRGAIDFYVHAEQAASLANGEQGGRAGEEMARLPTDATLDSLATVDAVRAVARVLRNELRAALAQNTQSTSVPAEEVTVEAVGTIRSDADGDQSIDWLIEGGICDLPVGTVLLCADRDVTDDEGQGTLYTRAESARVPAEPLDVFSGGAWTYSETGQWFTEREMNEAAFVAYRDYPAVTPSHPEENNDE